MTTSIYKTPIARAVHRLFNSKEISIIQFENEDSHDFSFVWVTGPVTQRDWVDWANENPYNLYESFDEYVEAFLNFTKKEYGFIVPNTVALI